jgi:hypothetical protein
VAETRPACRLLPRMLSSAAAARLGSSARGSSATERCCGACGAWHGSWYACSTSCSCMLILCAVRGYDCGRHGCVQEVSMGADTSRQRASLASLRHSGLPFSIGSRPGSNSAALRCLCALHCQVVCRPSKFQLPAAHACVAWVWFVRLEPRFSAGTELCWAAGHGSVAVCMFRVRCSRYHYVLGLQCMCQHLLSVWATDCVW